MLCTRFAYYISSHLAIFHTISCVADWNSVLLQEEIVKVKAYPILIRKNVSGVGIVWKSAIKRRRYYVTGMLHQIADNGINIPAYHNGAAL